MNMMVYFINPTENNFFLIVNKLNKLDDKSTI